MLFPITSSLDFLEKLLNKNKINILLNDRLATKDINIKALMFLSMITGGHPRSLEYIIKAILDNATVGIKLTDIPKIANASYFYSDDFLKTNIIKIVCLGEYVKLNDIILSESKYITVNDLVSSGTFLASLTESKTFPPIIPHLLLRYWAKINYEMIGWLIY